MNALYLDYLIDKSLTNFQRIESLRFRLVAYSRCASHGRSAPRCALRFRHFFNEGSGGLEIWYHKLQVALYMRHIMYKIIFEANNCLGCKDESPATRPFPSQKGKCISYMLSEALLLARSTYDTQYSCLFITHIAVSNYHIFIMLRIQYPLNGESATRSVAHLRPWEAHLE